MEILLQIWNINRVLYQTIQKRVKKLFLLLKKSYFAVNNSRLVWHLSQWENYAPPADVKRTRAKENHGANSYTNYLDFSEPRALAKLNELKNITLKMYDVEAADNGFHTKGYIFKKEEVYRIILGSSNMTNAALTSNIDGIQRLYRQSRAK